MAELIKLAKMAGAIMKDIMLTLSRATDVIT